jgi:hypothetical protein
MTYSVGGLIQAADINGFFVNNTNHLNDMWGTGSGDKGYGQTTTSNKSVGDTIDHTEWASLVNKIIAAASHQGTSVTSRTAPVTNDLVAWLTAVDTDLGTITTNRLNAAAAGSTGAATTNINSGGTWSNSLSMVTSITFADHNSARYFFNCGGQIGITASHASGTNINGLISNLCTDLGTIWLSAGTCTIGGVNYTGTTKIGGGNSAGATISTGTGFYQLSSSPTQLIQQTGDYVYNGGGWPVTTVNYTTGTFLRISASYNGSGTITITVLFDEVPNGATVAAGTVTSVVLRTPETTNITNSWGTPSVSAGAITRA